MSNRLDALQAYDAQFEEARLLDEKEESGTFHLDKATASLGKTDLFFLLVFVLGKDFCNNDWVFARSREVQESPDGNIDLWAREHFKSTIITFALSIFNIVNDPNVTIGIFSHTKPIAKKFLNLIKREFEDNAELKRLYPDIFYEDPSKQSQKWSEDGGIIVKRTQNKKESTVEAWGLVDGQPTGAHFDILVYDDVVTLDSVVTGEQIKKTTEAYQVSLNLGTRGGRRRVIGTRYNARDTYATMLDAGTYKVRIYPATVGGKDPVEHDDAIPVYLTTDELKIKRADMGVYVFACQMLQNPQADSALGFRPEWMIKDLIRNENLNVYILVDPSSGRKKDSHDYTAMAVIGLGADQNYYLLDAVRDRMNLTERANMLFELHEQYEPNGVGYEEYGLQADIEAIEEKQKRENYRFPITRVGGKMAKNDRILRLVPLFEAGRFIIQERIFRLQSNKTRVDIAKALIDDELLLFPTARHDDLADAMSRIFDITTTFPARKNDRTARILKFAQKQNASRRGGGSWMGR